MHFTVMTTFPEMFDAPLGESILGKAKEKGILEFNILNIRDFSEDKHKRTDDYPYGGGMGMVMTPQPIIDCWKYAKSLYDEEAYTIYMSPQGKVLTQAYAKELKELKHIIILCGHYEGVDERVIELIVDQEVSIGDFVLTGGEIPAMALIDCVSRLVDGVLPNEEAYSNESHENGLLEYPQYTRPAVYEGMEVPEVLLSGHHLNIENWRKEQSIERTKNKRPDLYEEYVNNKKAQD